MDQPRPYQSLVASKIVPHPQHNCSLDKKKKHSRDNILQNIAEITFYPKKKKTKFRLQFCIRTNIIKDNRKYGCDWISHSSGLIFYFIFPLVVTSSEEIVNDFTINSKIMCLT